MDAVRPGVLGRQQSLKERPEDQVDARDRHPASECTGLEHLLRGGARGEQAGLDPVRVRVPTPLAEQVPQLRLGDLLARRESDILDRLLHHCEAISINGPSYRLKNRLAALEEASSVA